RSIRRCWSVPAPVRSRKGDLLADGNKSRGRSDPHRSRRGVRAARVQAAAPGRRRRLVARRLVRRLRVIHSKEGQTAARDGQQISSHRADVPTSNLPNFQKVVLGQKYPPEEYAQHAAEWEKLFKQYFLTTPQ